MFLMFESLENGFLLTGFLVENSLRGFGLSGLVEGGLLGGYFKRWFG